MPAKKKASKTKKKSNFGWKVGNLAGYTYRSVKNPEGRVTSVTEGTTKKTAKATISPAPGNRFKASITRHLDKIHHISKYSKKAVTPISKQKQSKKRK